MTEQWVTGLELIPVTPTVSVVFMSHYHCTCEERSLHAAAKFLIISSLCSSAGKPRANSGLKEPILSDKRFISTANELNSPATRVYCADFKRHNMGLKVNVVWVRGHVNSKYVLCKSHFCAFLFSQTPIVLPHQYQSANIHFFSSSE